MIDRLFLLEQLRAEWLKSGEDCEHPEEALEPLPFNGQEPDPNEWECGVCGWWQVKEPPPPLTPFSDTFLNEGDLETDAERINALFTQAASSSTAQMADLFAKISADATRATSGFERAQTALERFKEYYINTSGPGPAYALSSLDRLIPVSDPPDLVALGRNIERVVYNAPPNVTFRVEVSQSLMYRIAKQDRPMMRGWSETPTYRTVFGLPLVMERNARDDVVTLKAVRR